MSGINTKETEGEGGGSRALFLSVLCVCPDPGRGPQPMEGSFSLKDLGGHTSGCK